MNKYPGGKNGSGSYQQIISAMPLHYEYIEGFFGSGAVWRNKKSCRTSTLIDLDETVLPDAQLGINPLCCDVLNYLQNRPFTGHEVIYLDPPYLFTSRLGDRKKIYKYEFGEYYQHKILLDIIKKINAFILISGYESELYKTSLKDWRFKKWNVRTHKGNATEYLWMNYPEPIFLHDTRYIGQNFISRQRIRRLLGLERR